MPQLAAGGGVGRREGGGTARLWVEEKEEEVSCLCSVATPPSLSLLPDSFLLPILSLSLPLLDLAKWCSVEKSVGRGELSG